MRLALSEGEMEENRIDVMISPRAATSDKPTIAVDNSNPGFEIFKLTKEGKGKKGEKKKMTVAEARPIIEENETERLMDEHDVLKEAIASVEVSTYVKSENFYSDAIIRNIRCSIFIENVILKSILFFVGHARSY